MRKSFKLAAPLAAMLTLAGQLMAGGFYLQLGNPEASPEARKAGAIVTIKALGCGEPAKAVLKATAIGLVNGKRQEIPLNVKALSDPGMFALTQQWPKEGRWVIQVEGAEKINGTPAHTYTLVSAGPEGVDRFHAKSDKNQFPASEIDAMLR
jgi:hypothetical protein